MIHENLRDPMGNKQLEAQEKGAQSRFQKRASERQLISRKLQETNPLEVESESRISLRKKLIDPRDGLAFERIMGKSDLFPISYFESGLQVAKPVCRIEIHDRIGRVIGYGTGFLVSSSLLLTNNHVLENIETARFSLAQFNYETDTNLLTRPISSFRLDPNVFFITDIDLDFTLVAVETKSADGIKLKEYGYLKMIHGSGKALLGEYVSIIQHPQGAPKSVAIRENEIKDIFDDYIHYVTDTQSGSSGAPVFNDEWNVVALHHAGVPDPSGSGEYIANEGIRISSIIRFLITKKVDFDVDRQKLLDEVLSDSVSETSSSATNISIIETEEPPEEYYTSKGGYDSSFLGNYHNIPLPSFRADLQSDIAHLNDGSSVLDYTHFSIVMSRSRRLAFYTAVNIDGRNLTQIKRNNDRWYFDPRLDRKFQCGPELYNRNDLDRGHLVRRKDPIWGCDAKEANEDTFHFTNSSPQHKNLNQKTWLNLEDYILNSARIYELKVTVFTGPVFRVDDIFYRDEFQIPAEFWKVVAFLKDNETICATAYLQTQKNMIENLEFAYGAYKTYQVQISKIEQLTGLKFGELSRNDPLTVLEAKFARVIENPQDIKY